MRKFCMSLMMVAMMCCQLFAQQPPKTCAEARSALDALIAMHGSLVAQRAHYTATLSTIHARINAIDAELRYEIWGDGFGDCQECQDLKQDLEGQLEGLYQSYNAMLPWTQSSDNALLNQNLVASGIQAMENDLAFNPGDTTICTAVYYGATGWAYTLAGDVMDIYLDRIVQTNALLDSADDLLDAAIEGCECSGGGEGDPE